MDRQARALQRMASSDLAFHLLTDNSSPTREANVRLTKVLRSYALDPIIDNVEAGSPISLA